MKGPFHHLPWPVDTSAGASCMWSMEEKGSGDVGSTLD